MSILEVKNNNNNNTKIDIIATDGNYSYYIIK